MRHGYLRISTPDQTTARQEDGLRAICDRLHIEQPCSAVAKRRPVFERVLRQLKAGDVLVVWALDRAFRSTLDALTIFEALYKRGIALEVVNLGIDLTTPIGRVYFTMTAALDEAERRRLSQRTKEGMAAARRRGVRLGRPYKLPPSRYGEVVRAVGDHGGHIPSVAAAFGVSPDTIRRALNKAVAA